MASVFWWWEQKQLHESTQPIETSLDASGNALRNAPGFSLPDRAGVLRALEDYRGKKVVLHFWASWCPPCIREIPQWIELGASVKSHSVQFIAVSLDRSWEDTQKVWPQGVLPPSSPIVSLLDTSGRVPESYGSYQFPETYLIDPHLKVFKKLVGPQHWDAPWLLDWIHSPE